MVDRMNYQGLIMPVIADLINQEILLGEQNQYNDNSGYVIRDNESKTGLLYSFVYFHYVEDFYFFYEIEFLFNGQINLIADFEYKVKFYKRFYKYFEKFKTEFQKVYLPLKNKLEGV